MIQITSDADANLRAAERHGLENGQAGIPHADYPELDPFERRVQSFYVDVARTRNKEFQDEIQKQEDLIYDFQLEGDASRHDEVPDYANETELAEAAMWQIIEGDSHKLQDLQEEAQKATDDLASFRAEHELERAPAFPEDRVMGLYYIAVFWFIETVINSLAFQGEVSGGLLGAIWAAGGISLINVAVLALAAGLLFRRTRYRAIVPRVAAWSGLAVVLMVVLSWNMAAGHYRDVVEGAEIPYQCQALVSDPADLDSGEIGAVAVCLFRMNGFALAGFGSYLLALIGLALFGVAAWKWWLMDDAYPGYGALERIRRQKYVALDTERNRMIDELDDRFVEGRKAVNAAFEDPVDRWRGAVAALRERERSFQKNNESLQALKDTLAQVIRMYRSSNRQARPSDLPVPGHWEMPYESPIGLPEPLADLKVFPFDRALELRQREMKILQECFSKLNSTHVACACRVLRLSHISNGELPEGLLSLSRDAERSEITEAVSSMGRLDGQLGIPSPDYAGESVNESTIRIFYSELVERNRSQYQTDLDEQVAQLDTRLKADLATEQESVAPFAKIGVAAAVDLRDIVTRYKVPLGDLRSKAQDAADAFARARSTDELAKVNKAAGRDVKRPASRQAGSYERARSVYDSAISDLNSKRDEALAKLAKSFEDSRSKLESAFWEPLEAWDAADRAINKCRVLHERYVQTEARFGDEYCEAISNYRTANRELRRDGLPAPRHWNNEVEAPSNGHLPPLAFSLCTYERATEYHERDVKLLDGELKALEVCRETSHSQVIKLSEIITM